MTNALENLPPEMQARLAQIMAGAQATGQATVPTETVRPLAPAAPPAPAHQAIIKPPSLMDHLIALRGEVAEMRNEIANLNSQVTANSNVVEAAVSDVSAVTPAKCFKRNV